MHHEVVTYSSSAVDYAEHFGEYGELVRGLYKRILPVNTIENANVIEFKVDGGDDFLDLRESFMRIEVQLLKADDTNLDEGANTAFVDNILHSIFEKVVIFLNGKKITDGNALQAYKNYFVARFGVSKSARNIHLKALQGLTGEAAGKHNTRNADATGWTQRKAWTAKSTTLALQGPIPSDFFMSCEKYLPPTVEMRLEFKLCDSDFATNTTSPLTVKFRVNKFDLMMRSVEIAATRKQEIFNQLRQTPWTFNYTSMDIQTHSIAAGMKRINIRNIFASQLPKQVYVMFAETGSVSGDPNADPFDFKHANIEKMVLRKNNVPLMVEEVASDFSTPQGAKEVYNWFLQALDVGFNSRDVGVTLEQFCAGCTVWAWTLCPDMDANSGLRIPFQPGDLQLDIHVNQVRNNPALTVIILGKFGSMVKIDEQGGVYTF